MAFLTLYLMLLAVSLFSTFFIRQQLLARRMSFPPLPPGPKLSWLPVFGNLFQMVKNKPTYKWIHKIMKEMKTEIACIRLGRVHVIIVTSAELAREFLKKQDSIFSSRPLSVAAEMTSYGYLSIIFSPYGHQWKKMKRILVSSMTIPTKYAEYSNTILQEADNLVNYILNQYYCKKKDSKNGGVEINVRNVARHYGANVMKRMIFSKIFFGKGTENGGPGFEDEEHVDALFVILAYLHSFSVSDFLPWIKNLDLDGHGKMVKEALRILRKYHDREIEQRISMWEKGLKNKQVDFLDVLIKLKDDNGRPQLSTTEIKALILVRN